MAVLVDRRYWDSERIKATIPKVLTSTLQKKCKMTKCCYCCYRSDRKKTEHKQYRNVQINNPKWCHLLGAYASLSERWRMKREEQGGKEIHRYKVLQDSNLKKLLKCCVAQRNVRVCIIEMRQQAMHERKLSMATLL